MKRLDKWFGTVDSHVSNYVYLLCDPLIWREGMNFGDFLTSIFYVGRGVGGRFLDHLREVQLILNHDYSEFDEEKVGFYEFLMNLFFVLVSKRGTHSQYMERWPSQRLNHQFGQIC